MPSKWVPRNSRTPHPPGAAQIGDMAQNNMAGLGPRIVLGIDYGTTYTGLAWMQTNGQDSPSLSTLTVFRDWPGKDAQKVPSESSYSASAGCRQWGYSISNNSDVIRWTKLELEPRTTVRELEVLQELVKGLDLVDNLRANEDAGITNDIPRHISKDAEDIVREYLGKVAREWYLYMRSVGRHTLERVPLDIVITHPASWAYEAKNKTFRAVIGAFQKGMFPTLRDISLTSEPEACALYTVQDLVVREDRGILIPGECFVVCDAGGGTVDLVSYRTDSIEPLILTRVGGVTGGKYGAIFIDQAFIEWLQPRLRNQDLLPTDFRASGRFVLQPMGRVLLDRFERIKCAFSGTETGDISLPRGTFVDADDKDGIVQGVVSLTEENLKNMFGKCVTGTVDLISRQVTQAENTAVGGGTPCQVTNIFLAGGFAESPYLFNEVKKWASIRGDIQVLRANDCWSGVVKGAVLRGMGVGMDPAAKVISCPRHYGICVSQVYADWMHNSQHAVMDHFDGRQVVPEQIVWLVRKGDLILPDEPIVSRFDVECRFTHSHIALKESMRIIFVATALDDPPSSLSNIPGTQNEVTYLDIPLNSIPTSALQWSPPLDGGTNFGIAGVRVRLQVSQSVRMTLECGTETLRAYGTAL